MSARRRVKISRDADGQLAGIMRAFACDEIDFFAGGFDLIEAVIFDIDGTLVDSVDLHARAWQEAFARFGKQIPYERVRYQIGKGGDQLMPVFLSKEELEEFGEELEKYRGELFKREYLPRVRAFPRVRELFERIQRDGKRIALASSSHGYYMKTCE